jgi:hypothetical protein
MPIIRAMVSALGIPASNSPKVLKNTAWPHQKLQSHPSPQRHRSPRRWSVTEYGQLMFNLTVLAEIFDDG